MNRRFQIFAYLSPVLIFCTVSLNSYAETATYKVGRAGFVNSMGGLLEAACRPGDQLVKGSCEGRFISISIPKSERLPAPLDRRGYDEAPVDYPLVTESEGEAFRCHPKMLRADQQLRLIVTAICRPSQT